MKTKVMKPLTLTEARHRIMLALQRKSPADLALVYNEVCDGSQIECVFRDGTFGVSDNEEATTLTGRRDAEIEADSD